MDIAVFVGAALGLILVAFGQPVDAEHELINTATNEIATPQDMGKRDFLEETYSELLQMKEETGKDYIVVEHDNVMTIQELEK